ncbi:type II toxin-antitoxin system VapC family toxin, partial [Sinorhizobium meliloti]|uniref:type II toxin-antitoxin system VapC family toxin n=1 Tax=Rhizobium meliloti TaxID=382 RepID=UPI001F3F95DD
MILADTSIWIDHFRHTDAELRRIIEDDRLLCHPAVIGELALGSLRERSSVIAFLMAQREALVATHQEVMMMIDRHAIFSMGIGYTDAHLLASVRAGSVCLNSFGRFAKWISATDYAAAIIGVSAL